MNRDAISLLTMPRTQMEARVLHTLLSRKSGWVSRDELVTGVYGDREPESAESCIRIFVSRLRRRAPEYGLRIESVNRSNGSPRRQAHYRITDLKHGCG